MSRPANSADIGQRMRPAAYLSCASLAHELEISESTVYELVRRGVLPSPIKLSGGCVRWCWADVQAALASLGGGSPSDVANDPFLTGVRNVTSAA
jgi:predicted DNA-binding transcriptional regulator AlpA